MPRCLVTRVSFMSAGLLLVALAAAACTPRPGGACKQGEARCEGAASELVCSDGRYVSTPCRGPKGCAVTADGVACDISANRPGDPCSRDDEGAAICLGEKRLLACRGAAYLAVECRGPRGCETEDGRARCDTSVAAEGDACHDAAMKACSLDGKTLLACAAGKLAALYRCRGDDGCAVAPGGKLDCDLSVAAEGDACDARLEGQVACAPDRRGMVRCARGKFAPDERCPTGKTCVAEGGSIACKRP